MLTPHERTILKQRVATPAARKQAQGPAELAHLASLERSHYRHAIAHIANLRTMWAIEAGEARIAARTPIRDPYLKPIPWAESGLRPAHPTATV